MRLYLSDFEEHDWGMYLRDLVYDMVHNWMHGIWLLRSMHCDTFSLYLLVYFYLVYGWCVRGIPLIVTHCCGICLAHGWWYMIYGSWLMLWYRIDAWHGIWDTLHGIWFMVYDMVHDWHLYGTWLCVWLMHWLCYRLMYMAYVHCWCAWLAHGRGIGWCIVGAWLKHIYCDGMWWSWCMLGWGMCLLGI